MKIGENHLKLVISGAPSGPLGVQNVAVAQGKQASAAKVCVQQQNHWNHWNSKK